jgi:Tol biopolymer transport system component
MARRRIGLLFLGGISAAILALVSANQSTAAYPGKNGDLLYLARRVGGSSTEILVVSPGGMNTRSLTASKGLDVGARATWSPDGTRIAFEAIPAPPYKVGDIGTRSKLYVMNADGSGLTQIITSPARDPEYPTWSPDGQTLAFVGVPTAGWRAVFTIGLDGTNLQTVIPDEPGTWDSYRSLAWSPDGGSLLFSGTFRYPCPDGCHWGMEEDELYILSLATGDIQRLTENMLPDQNAVWSPDGTRIAFEHHLPTPPKFGSTRRWTSQLLIMNLETGETRDISDDPTNVNEDWMPAWSPDGTLIAYVSTTNPQTALATDEVFIVAPDGTGRRKRVTEGPRHRSLDWQPIVPRFPQAR